jgi:D-alanine-D-alanine ligase
VLPLAEIAFQETLGRWPVYTFTAKWDMESDEYKTSPVIAPVEIAADDFERLRGIAERTFRLLECRDYARLDVRMATDGSFYILEMNPNPYLSSIALVNGLLAIGRTHEYLLVQLTLAALARGGKRPGEGEIKVPVGVVTAV